MSEQKQVNVLDDKLCAIANAAGLRWSGVVWEFFVESWGGWCTLGIYPSSKSRAMTFAEGLRHAHWRAGILYNAKLTDGANWPATRTVHCPNRPVNACDRHVEQITGMMAFLGTHVIHTAAPDGAQCDNCVNEHKEPNELLDSIIMMANDLRVLFICLQSTDPQSSNIEESLEFSSGIVVSMKRYRDERRIR